MSTTDKPQGRPRSQYSVEIARRLNKLKVGRSAHFNFDHDPRDMVRIKKWMQQKVWWLRNCTVPLLDKEARYSVSDHATRAHTLTLTRIL